VRKEEKFNNILNECLDRILKGETVDRCLLDYPEHSKELEPLLKTALAASTISRVQPRSEFKAEARRQFQAALIEMKVKQNEKNASPVYRRQWRWRSGWALSLIAVAVLALGGGSMVAAASGSMPDSGLYSIKLAAEKVQLAITPGDVARTELNAKFAERRTDEIVYLVEKDDVLKAKNTADRLNSNLANISNLAAGGQSVSESTAEPAPLMAPQPAGLSKNAAPSQRNEQTFVESTDTPVLMAVPANTAVPTPSVTVNVPAPRGSPNDNETVPAVGSQQDAISVAETATFASDFGASGQTDIKHSAKFERMKKIIQDNYEKRRKKLEDALSRASPELAATLQQAIDQSELEYQQALINLENSPDARD
jgi:hypothetical protein